MLRPIPSSTRPRKERKQPRPSGSREECLMLRDPARGAYIRFQMASVVQLGDQVLCETAPRRGPRPADPRPPGK